MDTRPPWPSKLNQSSSSSLHHYIADESKTQLLRQTKEKVLQTLNSIRQRIETRSSNDDGGEESALTTPQHISTALDDLSTAILDYAEKKERHTEELEVQLRKLRTQSCRHISHLKARVKELEEELSITQEKLIECSIIDSKHRDKELPNSYGNEYISTVSLKSSNDSIQSKDSDVIASKDSTQRILVDEYTDDDTEFHTLASDRRTFTKLRKSLIKIREVVNRYVNHRRTQEFLIALIIINSITMGIGTFDFVTENPLIQARFDRLDLTFLIIFTVELCLQFIISGIYIFRDRWNCFDFVVISISWIGELLGDGVDVSIIRAFRAFRSVRVFLLVPRIRVMRGLVSTLIESLSRLTAICALIGLLIYIFAVYFTDLYSAIINNNDGNLSTHLDHCGYDGIPEELGYFRRLDPTFLTLFQLMTLDDWVDRKSVV